MMRIAIRRLCAVLLVLTFAVGAPVLAVQGSAMGASVACADTPMSGDCDDSCCDVDCQAVWCPCLTAMPVEGPALSPSQVNSVVAEARAPYAGPSADPDPYPPRLRLPA